MKNAETKSNISILNGPKAGSRRVITAPVGKRFNNVIVIGEAEKGRGGRFRVKAKCKCGEIFECQLRHLESGAQQSCGCLKVKHGLDGHPLAQVWRSMRQRCENKNAIMYHVYGGKGIKVCKQWHDLKKFVEWSENNGWEPGLQIDRINNNKDYKPSNCRFVTPKQQQRNRSNNRIVKYKGENICIAELAEKVNQPYDRIFQRIFKLGWSVEDAVK